MIPRRLFSPEHDTFRDSVRRFIEAEVKPNDERWQAQGYVDRDVWLKAGANGFLCTSMPEQYGGAGADRFYSMVLIEEQARANNSSLGWGLHSEIVAPYLLNYGSESLKRAYLPKMASGEAIGAIAMSEPGAGSDLQSVKTTAVRKGNCYLVNGSKTFITNGWNADLVIVVAKTDPAKGAKGTSLHYVRERKAFGKPVASFQNTRFKLAEPATQAQVMRVFVDRCMELLLEGKLDTATASMAKYWASDAENRIIDECLQLHGGYGYMWEFPIAQAFVDARVTRIYGGTNEIMKEVISRSLGLGG